MDINLHGVFYFCKEMLPWMVKQKYGRIVNIASISGNISKYYAFFLFSFLSVPVILCCSFYPISAPLPFFSLPLAHSLLFLPPHSLKNHTTQHRQRRERWHACLLHLESWCDRVNESHWQGIRAYHSPWWHSSGHNVQCSGARCGENRNGRINTRLFFWWEKGKDKRGYWEPESNDNTFFLINWENNLITRAPYRLHGCLQSKSSIWQTKFQCNGQEKSKKFPLW